MTWYVAFESGGIERVGDRELEEALCRLAAKCNGEFSGSGFGGGVRDYGFVFKTELAAWRFHAELGKRARVWRIRNRDVYRVTWGNVSPKVWSRLTEGRD